MKPKLGWPARRLDAFERKLRRLPMMNRDLWIKRQLRLGAIFLFDDLLGQPTTDRFDLSGQIANPSFAGVFRCQSPQRRIGKAHRIGGQRPVSESAEE